MAIVYIFEEVQAYSPRNSEAGELPVQDQPNPYSKILLKKEKSGEEESREGKKGRQGMKEIN